MANLQKHDDRKDWLVWAVEFMRRGLWADDYITVHGPHQAPADHMWGEANAEIDGTDATIECTFVTPRTNRGKYDVRRVRIQNAHDAEERFSVLRMSELTPKARRWLLVARRLSKKLVDEAKADAAEARRMGQDALKRLGQS